MRKGIRPSQHFFSFFEKHETNRNIGSSSSVLSRSAAPRGSLPFIFCVFSFPLSSTSPFYTESPSRRNFSPVNLRSSPSSLSNHSPNIRRCFIQASECYVLMLHIGTVYIHRQGGTHARTQLGDQKGLSPIPHPRNAQFGSTHGRTKPSPVY